MTEHNQKAEKNLDADVLDNTRKHLQAWAGGFENDHYEFEYNGKTVTADVPCETIETIADITALLMDRIKSAQGDLTTEEYLELESRLQEKYPNDDGEWLINVVLDAVNNECLFDRYKEFEPMIAALNLRGFPARSTAYLLMIKFSILTLIYRMIRRVDEIQENYKPLACEFFAGVIAEGWGEGLGWPKKRNGKWFVQD